MARVNVETRALAEGRFGRLGEDLGMDKNSTIGLLVFFWHDSQERLFVRGRRETILKFINLPKEQRDRALDALVEHDYVTDVGDGEFEIRGNKRHVAFLEESQRTGQQGGVESGKSRRKSRTRKGQPGNCQETEGGPSSPEPNSMQCNSMQLNSMQGNATHRGPAPDEPGAPFVLEADPAPDQSERLTRDVWGRYSAAYEARYHEPPVRNAMVNGQIKQFVKRVGAEAPDVARFFVEHNDAFYVKTMHQVGALLKDAEKLRTEWKTNAPMLGTQAREIERRDHNGGVFDRAFENLAAMGVRFAGT